MIGQNELKERITKQIEENTFPHFCILTGAVGSGRKTMVQEFISQKLKAPIYPVNVSVAGIRDMIKVAHTVKIRTIYLIADADKMSNEAKNALLKITEEPPYDSYVIMTLEDINSTLDTIKSRSTVYSMDNYTGDEITQFALDSGFAKDDCLKIVRDICETPGEVRAFDNVGVLEFYNYVEKVVDNIAEVTDANSFKIAEKLALKADSDGYDLKLFLKAFMTVCMKKMVDIEIGQPVRYAAGVAITSQYLQQLGIRGVSKSMLVDSWIISIRNAWEG